MRAERAAAAVTVMAVLLMGCGTIPKDVRHIINDTNVRVRNLDQGLQGSVNRLNTTTAELIARANEGDTQIRQLQAMMEENQNALNALARELAELKTTLYRRWNLTVSSGAMPAAGTQESSVGGVIIEQPPTTAFPGPTDMRIAPPGGADTGALYIEAQRLYAGGNYADALVKYEEFLQRFPSDENSHNAQFWKAACYLNMERFQEAIQEFERLRTLYPTSNKIPLAMRSQAVAHSRLGQMEQAIRLFQEVIANYPTSPAADQAKRDLERIRGQ